MTIDEIIANEKDAAEHMYIEAMLRHANSDDGRLDECIERGRYHEQIVEWLEDYKRIKKWKDDVIDEICKYDANSIEELVYNTRRKAINDFADELKSVLPIAVHKDCSEIDYEVDSALYNMRFKIDKITDQLKAGITDD